MKASVSLAGVCSTTLLLAACGGGGSSSSAPTTRASVTSISADQLIYRKTTTVTVNGQNLTSGIAIANGGCASMIETGTPTATKRTFACKMIGVGTLPVQITASDGTVIYNSSLTIPLAVQPQVTMVTSMGTMVIQLNPARAPVSVDNFLSYAESGFYPNTIFHRVINNFVIQGGGYTSNLQALPTQSPIILESGNGLSNLRGTIAMARTSAPNSATSQFYFNTVNNTSLDATQAGVDGYAVFGNIVSGLSVMDAIQAVPTQTAANGFTDVPVTPVIINSVTQTQ